MAKNLEERVKELEKEVKTLKAMSAIRISKKLTVGDTFELVGLEWKILDITDKGYMCLAERLEDDMEFDTVCNDWKASKLRNYLNTEFYKRLAAEIGEENIITFERNLLSLDGQTEYGTCGDRVSMITLDEYRKYRTFIPNTDYWWWTITPDSTKCNGDTKWLRVVHPSGNFGNWYCNFSCGVRPVCIFSSLIFESED